jgi:hypothetical protein
MQINHRALRRKMGSRTSRRNSTKNNRPGRPWCNAREPKNERPRVRMAKMIEEDKRWSRPCLCEPGDPCDYHAAIGMDSIR